MLPVPAHDVPAGGVLDADLLAREADAHASVDDIGDECLALLVSRLYIALSNARPQDFSPLFLITLVCLNFKLFSILFGFFSLQGGAGGRDLVGRSCALRLLG